MSRWVMALLLGAMGVMLIPEGLESQTAQEKHEQMLYTVVRVRTAEVAGSGTVLWSGQDTKQGWHTYILTNHHVIEKAIKIEKKWDPRMGMEVKREFRSTVTVEFFLYNEVSRQVGVQGTPADIIAWDDKEDLALLETRERERSASHIAVMFPHAEVGLVRIYDPLWAVGASLGHAPISTNGILNYKDDEIDDLVFWMSSAQIIFGNSGGAMFRWSPERKRFEWVGVPSRMSVAGWGTPITHMGYFIPVTRVVAFLERNTMRFVFDKTVDYETELKLRANREKERQRATELKMIISGEGVQPVPP